MPLPMKKLDGHRMPQIQGARSKVDEFLAGSSIHGPLPIYAHRTCLEVCAPVRLQTINNDSHISLFDTASKGGKVQAQVFFCNLQHREGYAGLICLQRIHSSLYLSFPQSWDLSNPLPTLVHNCHPEPLISNRDNSVSLLHLP